MPQEALLDVASCLASNAQTQKGWNRIIIEKPFGFDALTSHQLTKSLLSKFQEKQLYRCLCTDFIFFNIHMCTKTQFIYLIYSDPSLYKLAQSYFRIDHLLGRNLIENLTVLRFANLVFQPLWSRTYIRNVQVPFYNNINMFLMQFTEISLNCEITYCRSFYQKTWPCRQEGNHKGCL